MAQGYVPDLLGEWLRAQDAVQQKRQFEMQQQQMADAQARDAQLRQLAPQVFADASPAVQAVGGVDFKTALDLMANEALSKYRSDMAAAQLEGAKRTRQETLYKVIDPTTGKPVMRPASEAAGLQPYDAPQNAPASLQVPQRVTVALPDGTQQDQWVLPGQSTGTPVGAPVKPGANKAPSDVERMAAAYLQRMTEAEKLLGQYQPSTKDYAGFERVLNGGAFSSAFGNALMSDQGQSYFQAAADWVRAKLRKESGAAIGVQEMMQEIRTYFPMPGDSAAVIAQKAQARQTAMQGMGTAAGPAAQAVAPRSNDLAAEAQRILDERRKAKGK